MNHRIRAAGIAVRGDSILLVKHVIDIETFWVPPGGGLEPGDGSTVACVEREYWEETGLRAEVGKLLYVREFDEPSRNRFHLELFYLVTSVSGTLTLKNLVGLGEDEFDITEVAWVPKDKLADITVYPSALRDDLWQRLATDDLAVRHLGVHIEASTAR